MAELIFGVAGIITGVAGTICALVVATRNKKKDDKKEGKEDGVVLTELGYIKKGIDGIERRMEKQETQYINVIAKLTEVESSAKQAHKRIDALEEYHKPH